MTEKHDKALADLSAKLYEAIGLAQMDPDQNFLSKLQHMVLGEAGLSISSLKAKSDEKEYGIAPVVVNPKTAHDNEVNRRRERLQEKLRDGTMTPDKIPSIEDQEMREQAFLAETPVTKKQPEPEREL